MAWVHCHSEPRCNRGEESRDTPGKGHDDEILGSSLAAGIVHVPIRRDTTRDENGLGRAERR